jgi:hypothetical protein
MTDRYFTTVVSVGDAGLTQRPAVIERGGWPDGSARTVKTFRASEQAQADKLAADLNAARVTEAEATGDRWDRLAADLRRAGIDARLDRTPYQQIEWGRMVYGTSSSIWIPVPGRGGVSIRDKFATRGTRPWLGWSIWAEDSEGIQIGREPRWTKKRGEAVANAREALSRIGGRT